MKRAGLLLILSAVFLLTGNAQVSPAAWDNNARSQWPGHFEKIQIRSSADSSVQFAWFYKTQAHSKRPLIVSLHTWSGDYDQEDPLADEVVLRDWNYIHPDFRGPNNTPRACGSPLVISDIEDAIRFAIRNGNVDTANVHIIGVSGGGYAAMLMYMKMNYPVKSFNAWVGISDLSAWYWESKARNSKYAADVEMVARINGRMDWKTLDARSPLKLEMPAGKRKNAVLNIYAGIHDGYTGSVPVSHSVLFYNKIAAAIYPRDKQALVSDKMLISLLAKQMNPDADTSMKLAGRKIHLQRSLPGLSLTLFEGGHEMLVPAALALIPADDDNHMAPLRILTIGDSNGVFDYGWPQQLIKLLPYATVINRSVSGNTIGFDNLGQPALNTLTNLTQYLDDGLKIPGGKGQLDYIFINIGTNDTKAVFSDRQNDVAANMTTLLQRIHERLEKENLKNTKVCIITPSPVDEMKADTLKYGGGDERIRKNNLLFEKIAAAGHTGFLDTYSLLKPGFTEKTTDGIHMNVKAQFEVAAMILHYINKGFQP